MARAPALAADRPCTRPDCADEIGFARMAVRRHTHEHLVGTVDRGERTDLGLQLLIAQHEQSCIRSVTKRRGYHAAE